VTLSDRAPHHSSHSVPALTGDRLTEDRLLGGRVLLAQPASGFRAGLDAVFLAAAVAAQPGEQVLELGCGTGAASLCLAVRVPGLRVAGLDKDLALVRLAAHNAECNGLAGRVQVFHGDLMSPPMRLAPASFDHVMANPPYRAAGQGRPPQDDGRIAATIEDAAALKDWLNFALVMLRPQGRLTMIYAAERLDILLVALAAGWGGIRLFPLWPGGQQPAADQGLAKPAKRVLLSARRGSRAPIALLPGLTLHRPDGGFTPAAEAILRDAAALSW
jgi:tRNA1(Val) A37 N6-methylase TrmN6